MPKRRVPWLQNALGCLSRVLGGFNEKGTPVGGGDESADMGCRHDGGFRLLTSPESHALLFLRVLSTGQYAA